jgi:hypothetical protein
MSMLVHIRPRLFSPFKNVALIDLEIDPLRIHLAGGVDLATRRPYPNKRYAVACRKQGHKAIDGILIEARTSIDDLRTTARWAIESACFVTHHVHYRILDHDFDAASDDMMLWYAYCAELGGWRNRFPAWAKEIPPIYAEPMMEVIPGYSERRSATQDILNERGWIVDRRQTFSMPTIERERILATKLSERIPPLDAAFSAGSGMEAL